MPYDYDTEDQRPPSDGWRFAAIVATCCLAGAVTIIIVTALARHA